MNKETFGTILALLTAVISGLAIPVNKIFVVDLDPSVFTAVRAVIIGVIFLGLSIMTNRFYRRNMREMNWKYLLFIAVIGGAFAFLLFFTGLKFTTGGRAAFLHKTLPLYVAIFAFIFLREKIPRKQVYALIVMLVGTVLLFSAQINPADLWMNPQLGDALVIGATVLWALENVVARKTMLGGETNFFVSFARMFFGGVILFGVAILLGKFDLLFSLAPHQWFNISVSVAFLFGYVLFWYWSIRYINVSKASSLLLLAPVVSLVAGVLWLGEPSPNLQLIGSALIMIGAYFVLGIKSRFITGV
jgi:drug/metabolite transporter (DMT)-like permease